MSLVSLGHKYHHNMNNPDVGFHEIDGSDVGWMLESQANIVK